MALILKHQTQPCLLSCVTASVAIVAGIDALKVRERFHNRYHGPEMISLRDMLDESDIPFKTFEAIDRCQLTEPGAYIVTVPSLNVRGGMHQAVIEMDEHGDWQILDPAKGVMVDGKPRSYYVAGPDDDPAAFMLSGGYQLDAYISTADLLALRQ